MKARSSFIIEYTGPIGTGKSHGIDQVYETLAETLDVILVGEKPFSARRTVPKCILDVNSHNVKTDLFLLPWAVLSVFKHFRFTALCIKLILINGEGVATKLAVFRSFWRKAGLASYFRRRRFQDSIVIIDEGLFHFAHNILMSGQGVSAQKTIAKFLKLVPKPDLLVATMALPKTIKSRLLERGDVSVRATKDGGLDVFIENACHLFKVIYTEIAPLPFVLMVNEHKNLTDVIKFKIAEQKDVS